MNNKKLYEAIMSSVSKKVMAAINESDYNDGWDEDQLDDLIELLDKIQNLSYEIKHCRRGVYTGATTYDELSEYVERIADKLQDAANDIKYCSEPEPDEDEEDF